MVSVIERQIPSRPGSAAGSIKGAMQSSSPFAMSQSATSAQMSPFRMSPSATSQMSQMSQSAMSPFGMSQSITTSQTPQMSQMVNQFTTPEISLTSEVAGMGPRVLQPKLERKTFSSQPSLSTMVGRNQVRLGSDRVRIGWVRLG